MGAKISPFLILGRVGGKATMFKVWLYPLIIASALSKSLLEREERAMAT